MSSWHRLVKSLFTWLCAFTTALLMLLLSTSVVAQQTRGQIVDWLYEVDQFVPDQSDRARLAAGQRSLLRVLSRTTGLASIPRSATVAKALTSPDRYYTKYVYFDPRDLDAEQRGLIDNASSGTDVALALRFDFQPAAIKQLVRDAQLPTWWSRRPLTMVWMVLDEPSGRRVVDHSAIELRNELDARAQQRGLPTMLPLMDLQDSVQVSPPMVWGRFTDVLDQASERYMASQYLLGRFSVQEILGERLYTGEWLVRSSDGESSQYLLGVDRDNLVRTGIDMATRHVLDQHLIFTSDSRNHDLVVRGIKGLQAYAGLLDYLQSLEFIDSVMLLGLQADALTLRVNTVATDRQLQSLLIDDGQFDTAPQPPPILELPLNESLTNLEFVWLGRS
jgi:hypothetical protein